MPRRPLFLALLAVFCGGLRAQSDEFRKDAFKEKIEAIRTSPLEILPVSDCRLADLESAIFLAYTGQGRPVPSDLRLQVERKRKEIDFMRSHVDSLYYIQALQALNQSVPDWKSAAESTEKALMHNRFFVKAIALKMTCLLLDKDNAQTMLRYMHGVLQECSFPEKIRQTAQCTYNTLLDETQDLIDHKRYRDALDLCRFLENHCMPDFPIRYVPYREKRLKNLAHQGIYHSYCEVADKAFSQGQYQLSQKYALQAFDYFAANEKHMNGVNRALDLLERIACRYEQFAALSDYDEQAFYLALVDTIVNRTGLVKSPPAAYRPREELAKELALLNHVPEIVAPPRPIDTFTALDIEKAEKAASFQVRLSSRQAKEQFGQACEQARYLKAKRKFGESYPWFEQALSLKRQYNLHTDADFDEECRNTLAQAVEQLSNKAVFHLWNNDEPRADSLYAQACGFAGEYQRQNPEDNAFLTRLRQILDAYLQKRDENRCQALQRALERVQGDFYRQASFGNHALARQGLEQADSIQAKYRLPEFSSCTANAGRLEEMKRIMTGWNRYRDSLQAATDRLAAGDTVGFLRKYAESCSFFAGSGLGAHVPAPPSLFSRLSTSGDLPSLLIWAECCVKEKDWRQARFIVNYLTQRDYESKRLDKLTRTLRRTHE